MLGDMNGHKNNVKMKHASLSQRISLSREHVRFVDLRGAVVRNIDAAEMRQLKDEAMVLRSARYHLKVRPHIERLENGLVYSLAATLEDRTRWTRAICIASGLNMKRNDRKMETTYALQQIKKQVRDFEAISVWIFRRSFRTRDR